MAGNLITDRVKQLVRMRGPVIPSQISKEIGTNILMASAILSELASKSDVKISSVKVGGTPLYYVPGQEAKLQNYLASLHQKEREAFEQLKSGGVLLDTALDPATRVAMRQLKDFAKPLEASIDGETQLFWKWYLLPNEEAEAAIKKTLGIAEERAQTTEKTPAIARIEPVVGTQTAITTQQPVAAVAVQSAIQQQPVQTALLGGEATKPQASKQARPKAPTQAALEFAKTANEFFAKNNIDIELERILSKSEAEYTVLLPSPIGKLRYYCIAKNKKTCTDSDISSAIVQGQLKKLPVLMLTKGELTKKAQQLLSKEIGAIVIKKI
ncbi:hypothetical protein HYU40_01010 [Candidatus Woesearchaeota archaeon]|nr:hypothetical protein [Candidatus Woesearchaeota archaeon]